METAITESFMKSVQAAVDQCMEKIKEESRIFANALGAVRHLPIATPVPAPAPVPDTGHLEHRIAALELAYQRQVQKTIAGLSEDIGDLDGRLASLERGAREESGPWKPIQESWSWPGPSTKNEVVVDDRTTVLDFGSDMLVNVNHIDDDVEMITSAVPVKEELKKEEPKELKKEESKKEPEPEPEPEADEEGNLELEELEYEGTTYYKDPDNNVYKANEDGEVDAETPVGRWLETKGKIKFY